MNKITLQDLTPDVYYNQSRDFQFIGRLFDIVLNSVKVNTENLYNLPLNENTDERLIDLMTMTLGFKSKHNYNVKQLTSLCNAFTVIIKNKGNIQSVILAVRALLKSEGITDDMTYELSADNTVLHLYVSQALTDLNLLRDLLDYILPAGMSYNIYREAISETSATIEVTNTDKINIKFDGNLDTKSILPQLGDASLYAANASDTAGLIMNSEIIQIAGTSNNNKTGDNE